MCKWYLLFVQNASRSPGFSHCLVRLSWLVPSRQEELRAFVPVLYQNTRLGFSRLTFQEAMSVLSSEEFRLQQNPGKKSAGLSVLTYNVDKRTHVCTLTTGSHHRATRCSPASIPSNVWLFFLFSHVLCVKVDLCFPYEGI